MTSLIWSVADRLGVAPIKPDDQVAVAVASWWNVTLTVGCPHVRIGEPWFVAFPDPSLRCLPCGIAATKTPGECVYCSTPTVPKSDDLFLIESRGVTLAFAAHARCHP